MNPDKPIGATVTLPDHAYRTEWFLFSETQSRFLLSVAPQNQAALEQLFSEANIPCVPLGTTGGKELIIQGVLQFPFVLPHGPGINLR